MDISHSPGVSVLIPCYNSARFLRESLESVLSQKRKNTEIIVVDDGSTDDSLSIARSYEQRGVRTIWQSKAGAAAARNRAFAASSGEFVLYLDADDLIGEHHLSALVERLVDSDGCVAMSAWDRFYLSPSEATFPNRPGYRDAEGVDWLAADWSEARPMTQSGMFLIPRGLVESAGGWSEALSLNDDFEFFARTICRSKGVRFAPGARLYYRSAVGGSLSGRKDQEAMASALSALTLGTQHLLDLADTACHRRCCANLLQNFEYAYFPGNADLLAIARQRITELGGADLSPDGPPGFHAIRRLFGWRVARRMQHLAERLQMTRAARTRRGINKSSDGPIPC